MPLNEIPDLNPETRHLVDAALEDAWRELNKDGLVEAHPARMKLASTLPSHRLERQTPASSNGSHCTLPKQRSPVTKAKSPALPRLRSERASAARLRST